MRSGNRLRASTLLMLLASLAGPTGAFGAALHGVAPARPAAGGAAAHHGAPVNHAGHGAHADGVHGSDPAEPSSSQPDPAAHAAPAGADRPAPAPESCGDCACPAMAGGCAVARPAVRPTWSAPPAGSALLPCAAAPTPRGTRLAEIFRPPRA